jgi:hypothetical protein
MGGKMTDTAYGNYSENDIKEIASVAHNMEHGQKLALIRELINITQSRMTVEEDDPEWEHIAAAEMAIAECQEIDDRDRANEDAQYDSFLDSPDAYLDNPRI